MRITVAMWVIALLGLASVAHAQPASGTIYLEGGATLSHQSGDSGTVHETYVSAPGGTTLGWLVGGGVGIGRRASVAVEFSSTGTMAATESSRYFTTYEESRRDRFLIAGVRFSLSASDALVFEPVVGLAITFAEASSQAIYTDPFSQRPADVKVTHDLNPGVGPAFGLDVCLGSGRVAVVPGVRIIRSAISSGRYDDSSGSSDVDISSIYPGGYPAWTTRASVVARVGF